MHRYPFAALLIIILSVAMVVPAAYADPATDAARREIQAVYDKINAALSRRDAKAAFVYMTPDTRQITERGQSLAGDKLRAVITRAYANIQVARLKTTVQSVQLQKNTATVSVRSLVTLQVKSRKTGMVHTIVTDETARDTWQKGPQGWRIRVSQVVRSRQTVDSKPVGGQQNDR